MTTTTINLINHNNLLTKFNTKERIYHDDIYSIKLWKELVLKKIFYLKKN